MGFYQANFCNFIPDLQVIDRDLSTSLCAALSPVRAGEEGNEEVGKQAHSACSAGGSVGNQEPLGRLAPCVHPTVSA